MLTTDHYRIVVASSLAELLRLVTIQPLPTQLNSKASGQRLVQKTILQGGLAT